MIEIFSQQFLSPLEVQDPFAPVDAAVNATSSVADPAPMTAKMAETSTTHKIPTLQESQVAEAATAKTASAPASSASTWDAWAVIVTMASARDLIATP